MQTKPMTRERLHLVRLETEKQLKKDKQKLEKLSQQYDDLSARVVCFEEILELLVKKEKAMAKEKHE